MGAAGWMAGVTSVVVVSVFSLDFFLDLPSGGGLAEAASFSPVVVEDSVAALAPVGTGGWIFAAVSTRVMGVGLAGAGEGALSGLRTSPVVVGAGFEISAIWAGA